MKITNRLCIIPLIALAFPLASLAAGIYIDTEDAQPYLKTATEFESAGQWDKAIGQYELLLHKYPATLCRADANRYLGIREYYHEKLRNYPADGKQAYRERFDARSEIFLGRGLAFLKKNNDVVLLKQLADEMLFSSGGVKAAVILGDYYGEQDTISGLKYYQAGLAGASWRSDPAEKMIQLKIQQWNNSLNNIQVSVPPLKEWPKWGGNNANNLTIIENDKAPDKIYPLSNTLSLAWQQSFASLLSAQSAISVTAEFPLCYPVFGSGYTYLNLGKYIIALENKSGKVSGVFPAHLKPLKFERKDKGQPDEVSRQGDTETSFITLAETSTKTPRLYAIMDKASQSGAKRLSLISLEASALKQTWSSAIFLADDEPAPRNIANSPILVCGAKIYFGGFAQRDNEWQFYLHCFDSGTGQPVYQQLIYSLDMTYDEELRLIRIGRRNHSIAPNTLITRAYLAEENRIIYCLTSSALIAIDAETGRVLWLNYYAAEETAKLPKDGYDKLPELASAQLNYPVIKGGVIMMQSIYTGRIIGFDALTGRKKWQSQQQVTGRFIGCIGSTTVIQGEEMTCINILNGKLAWKMPLSSLAGNIGEIIGQGFITTKFIYLPATKGVLFTPIPPTADNVFLLRFLAESPPKNWQGQNKMLLYRTEEGLLIISDKGVALYQIR